MNRTWMISDLHFGHENIIKYSNRPFETVEEMNSTIITNINKKVKNGHDLFILGDFCIGGNDMIADFCSQINGNKFLVLGNHDSKSPKRFRELGFDEVFKYPIILEEFYILSHKPVFLNDNMPYVNIHGHIHQNVELCESGGKNMYYNVCVEQLDYSPIDFNKIKEYYTVELEND